MVGTSGVCNCNITHGVNRVTHSGWRAYDGGQRRLLQPVRRARGGAQQLCRRGAQVGWSTELRGVIGQGGGGGGGGRMDWVRQLLVQLLSGLIDFSQGRGAMETCPQKLRGRGT